MSEGKKRGTAATVGLWLLTLPLVVAMASAGVTKFTDPDMWNDRFVSEWGLPLWLVPITGVMEALGAALLLVPRIAVYGAVLVAAAMVGAAGTLLANGQMGSDVVPPVVLLVMSLVVGWIRRADAGGPLGTGAAGAGPAAPADQPAEPADTPTAPPADASIADEGPADEAPADGVD